MEQQPMGFRAQIREILSHESVVIVPVTERNLPRFDETLTKLGAAATSEGGMLNINKQATESNADWAKNTKSLWLFGAKEANMADPEAALGFVNVYEPEHMEELNKMLTDKGKRPYDQGAIVEFASYAKEFPNHVKEEESAVKQSLARIFMDEQFKDVRAVSVWVTHEPGNMLDAGQEKALRDIGAMKLGALRYDLSESVDSTAFVIPRKAFLDALTAPKLV